MRLCTTCLRAVPVRPAALILLMALTVLTGARAVEAQLPELPTFQDMGLEYISESGFFQLLLSGRLDLEGMHVGNDWQPDVQGLDECDACHVDIARQMQEGQGTLETYRLRVFADVFLGDHLYSLVEFRSDRGLETRGAKPRGRIEQAFVRLVTGSGREGLQVGRFASPFGSYAPRHLTVTDPFLTAPLAYDYRTVMNRWRIPADAADFLGWKDAPEGEALPGAPPVWEVAYQWGAMAFASLGPVDMRLAAMNSAPSSHPRAWRLNMEAFERPSWVVGARWKASASIELGASYDRGPWLAEPTTAVTIAPPGAPPAAAPADWRDFDQELISVDVAFARGPVMIRAEAIRDRWEVPNVDGMPTGLSGNLEVQSDLAAGLFVGLRGGFIDFRPHPDGLGVASPYEGGEADWDHDVYRVDGSLGYRLGRNTGLLLSAYRQLQTDQTDGDTSFVGLRLWWAF